MKKIQELVDLLYKNPNTNKTITKGGDQISTNSFNNFGKKEQHLESNENYNNEQIKNSDGKYYVDKMYDALLSGSMERIPQKKRGDIVFSERYDPHTKKFKSQNYSQKTVKILGEKLLG